MTMNSNTVKRRYLICMVIASLITIVGLSLYGLGDIENIRIAYIRDIAVDSMGMLICGNLLLGLYAGRITERQNQSMFRMVFSLNALFFFDLISSYIEGNANYVTAIMAVNTFVFIFEDILGLSYWMYIRNELDIKGKFLNIASKVCLVVTGINILFDFINIKLGIFFTVSEKGEYIDSSLEGFTDIAIAFIFGVAIVAIIKSGQSLREKLILLSFESFPLAAYIAGSITQEYTWVYPAYLLSVLLIYTRIFLGREKKIAEQQVLLTKQSTALMISQIQPHFLYNVLTTISNLCATDPEEAEETTVLFSQYLRTNLDSLRNQEPVPFATELSHIKTYVELEKKRFGDILSVEYDINEQNFKVPSLGLQPIVENSIKHGIRGKNAPGCIKIGTYKVDNGYKIIIEDDGVGFDTNAPAKEDGRSHVGMTNVKERLRRMCNASMTVESSPSNGCRTEIIIPEE